MHPAFSRAGNFAGRWMKPGEAIPTVEPRIRTVGRTFGTVGSNHDTVVRSLTKTPTVGTKKYTPVIEKIMLLCGIPADSVMAKYIEQEGWTTIQHVFLVGVDEC